LDDREGCVFWGVALRGGVLALGAGVLALGVTVAATITGSGVLSIASGITLISSCKIGGATFIAFGYKSPMALMIVFGYISLDIVAGAAVIIVTNKEVEMTGTRSRDHFIFFKFFHPSINLFKDTGV